MKAKPIGAEMSPPPTASPSSRPLPPPPKTVAPAKPGDVSKAKAETKDPGRVGWMVVVICGYRVMESQNGTSPAVSKA